MATIDGKSKGNLLSGGNSNGNPQPEHVDPLAHLSQVKKLLDPIPPAPEQEVYKVLDWKSEDTDGSLIISVDMPGLSKEHVKVSVEENTLIIQGENQEEARSYGGTMDLPKDSYQMDHIKPVVKNGVLKLFIPKLKKPAKALLYLDVE